MPSTAAATGRRDTAWPLDLPTVLRLLRHEAAVHAVPGRELRELGDSLLLFDPVDPEPFWNRLEAVQFPSEPTRFDQRLAEVRILFASVGRQPHIWLLPPYDTPPDVFERLIANGFEDAGPGHLMAATDDLLARRALERPVDTGITVERHGGVTTGIAESVARDIVDVLTAAFGVGQDRRTGIIAETLASLADPRFTHYLVRLDGIPVAVARRATFDGLSYLSSIGTSDRARGRGIGRLVTATATVDGFSAGSSMVHLGVFSDNVAAKSLYDTLGYRFVGEAGPDMLLVG